MNSEAGRGRDRREDSDGISPSLHSPTTGPIRGRGRPPRRPRKPDGLGFPAGSAGGFGLDAHHGRHPLPGPEKRAPRLRHEAPDVPPARNAGSPRGSPPVYPGPGGRRSLHPSRDHLRFLPPRLRPQFPGRQRHGAPGQRPLRPGLRQRFLERRTDGFRRRRRKTLSPLHQKPRRRGPRAGPRRHRPRPQPRVLRPAGGPQRALRRCPGPLGQAVDARPDGAEGRLARRLRDHGAEDEGPGHPDFQGRESLRKRSRFGTDPQPKHMRDYYDGDEDDGGVHINSGIPNHAFYRAVAALGGRAWETLGPIWYKALLRLGRRSDFQEAARTTLETAERDRGRKSREAAAVRAAWKAVGVSAGPEKRAAAWPKRAVRAKIVS